MSQWKCDVARKLAPLTSPLNRSLGRFHNTVWMVGDGRSGSSWTANIVSSACGYRQLFEPIHPIEVAKFRGYALNHFQQPGSSNEPLRARLEEVFAGRINNRRVNQSAERFFYDGLLVKDVFATLLAAWAMESFPQVKLVLQIRNPFAVALSKSGKPHWAWTRGPLELLRQPALVEAHLAPHADFLRYVEGRGDPLLNHVAVWAILHRCLFRDFDARRLHILIYSRALQDPWREIRKLLAHIGTATRATDVAPEILEQPARYSESGSVGTVRLSGDQSWMEAVTSEQIGSGNEILARFGLADLFDKGRASPDFEAIAASLYRGNRQDQTLSQHRCPTEHV